MNPQMYRNIGCLIAVCLMSAMLALPAFSAGRMVIKPVIETGFQMDSNFHRAEDRSQAVHTYTVKPGIDLGYTTDKSVVGLNYKMGIFRYDDRDDVAPGGKAADEFDYVGHDARLYAQTQVSDQLRLSVDNLFIQTRDPASADVNANAVDRFKYVINTFNPRLLYQFTDRISTGLGYRNTYTDYMDDGPGQGEDSNENRGIFTLFYQLNSRTVFDLDYQYWQRDYDKRSSDYDSHQVMAGVSRQFNYLTLSAGAGFHHREFDRAVSSGDIDRFVWRLSALGQNPPDAAGIPKSSVLVSLSSNFNDAGNGDTYFTSTRLDVRLSYLLMEKINTVLSGYFQNADYKTTDREDDRWLVSLAGHYLINDYFTAGLEGGYEERDSNFTGRSFDNSYLMFFIRFNYDLRPR